MQALDRQLTYGQSFDVDAAEPGATHSECTYGDCPHRKGADAHSAYRQA
jgi:hypothetical protein